MVFESLQNYPNHSTRERAAMLGISYTTLQHIMKELKACDTQRARGISQSSLSFNRQSIHWFMIIDQYVFILNVPEHGGVLCIVTLPNSERPMNRSYLLLCKLYELIICCWYLFFKFVEYLLLYQIFMHFVLLL